VRVLGIDPGLTITGYACVVGDPARPGIVEAGVVRLNRARHTRPIEERLIELDTEIRAVIERTSPDLVALEGMFTNPKHPATVIKMAHGRGVIMLAAGALGVRIVELKPAEVKKALTGTGRAQKHQIQSAVQGLFALPEPPSPPDLADAIAIGVCALRRDDARLPAP